MSDDEFFDRIARRLSALRERGCDVMRRADEMQHQAEARQREYEASANAATRRAHEHTRGREDR